MLASSTHNEPPVGNPLFCAYQLPSNLPHAALILRATKFANHFLNPSSQSGQHVRIASFNASMT